MASTTCTRCGGPDATSTELRHANGKVTHRVLDESCRDRYNSDAYPAISEAIDLAPIAAYDPFLPAGEDDCPVCGKHYKNVRKHQMDNDHGVSEDDAAVGVEVKARADASDADADQPTMYSRAVAENEDGGEPFTVEREIHEVECDHEENCGFEHWAYVDDHEGASFVVVVVDEANAD